jgi:2-polyprenyl-3-methyl-5-hydroxy-6-metoxy-1,4-benzoquinol methylase
MAPETIDPATLERLGQQVEAALAGATTVGLLYLGDQLGLFAALRAAGPSTAEDLAARTGLVERYVREWLAGMSAAGLLAYEPGTGRFALTPEQAACLADPASLTYAAPMATLVLKILEQADGVATAFRQGGGVRYDRFDPLVSAAIERSMEAPYHAYLVAHWLPAVPGVGERLAAGGSALDVGCGGGLACVEMGVAFPRATILGLDLHAPSIARARAHARSAGVEGRVRFEAAAVEQLPAGTRFDLVTTFDVVHDLADPVGTLRAMRAVLAPGGSCLVMEPKVSDRLEENTSPRSQLRYGLSVFHCLTQSLAGGGAGLGTCMGEGQARALAAAAGFGHFTVLPIEDADHAFYHLRP